MDYVITMDKSKIDISKIYKLLHNTYWANDRSKDIIEKSIDNSEVILVFDNLDLVGFARLVTDKSTFFWICDVIVDENYRNKGIGKLIIEYIKNLEYYEESIGILFTKDAHSLYEKIGFNKIDNKIMVKPK